eukprot:7153679-Prymnesium_polylepis.2
MSVWAPSPPSRSYVPLGLEPRSLHSQPINGGYIPMRPGSGIPTRPGRGIPTTPGPAPPMMAAGAGRRAGAARRRVWQVYPVPRAHAPHCLQPGAARDPAARA